jgi:DNA-binding GntR family transcriptional regulator
VTISRDGAVPAYQQIADDLRAAITAGRYPVGERLPVERELARQYGVTAMTVRHGLDVLRAEGVIVSHEKRGHFVAKLPDADGGEAHSAEYFEVMAALRAVQEELRKAQFRLDRLEEIARDADRPLP